MINFDDSISTNAILEKNLAKWIYAVVCVNLAM